MAAQLVKAGMTREAWLYLAMPGTHLIMVGAELILDYLEAPVDRPTRTSEVSEGLERHAVDRTRLRCLVVTLSVCPPVRIPRSGSVLSHRNLKARQQGGGRGAFKDECCYAGDKDRH